MSDSETQRAPLPAAPDIRPMTVPGPKVASSAPGAPAQTGVSTPDINEAFAAFSAQVPNAEQNRDNPVTDTEYAVQYWRDNHMLWTIACFNTTVSS